MNAIIQKIIDYYDGNETNEMIIDPYIILCSLQLQSDHFDEATQSITKAEKITKELCGDYCEKLIDIYAMFQSLNYT